MEKPTNSSMNFHTAGTASMLVETVADLMSLYMQTGHLNNLSVFSDLCLSLAKGIDHAVANNEVPLRSHELPSLLKQVYKYRNDFFIQEASMVLLMYVKSTCKVGWFQNEDADDLLKLIQEVSRRFSSAEDADVDPSYAYPYVSRVSRRFFPKLQMDRIIATFQIKAGFGAFHADFHIVRGMVAPGKEEILLLVTNVDDMETSSCMIAPPETRTIRCSFPPTSLNAQIWCQSSASRHYIAVIGIMSLLPSLESPGIKDCSRAPSLACPDLEIVETSSRVSPNWPITQTIICYTTFLNSCLGLSQVFEKIAQRILYISPKFRPM